jgi:hypothetical protein
MRLARCAPLNAASVEIRRRRLNDSGRIGDPRRVRFTPKFRRIAALARPVAKGQIAVLAPFRVDAKLR